MAPYPFQRLTVVGVGLIGGSVALAARRAWPELWIEAVDAAADVQAYAQLLVDDEANAVFQRVYSDISEIFANPTPSEHADSLATSHLIVIAAHLSANRELLQRLSDVLPPDANPVISDIGSCKRQICALGESLFPEQFIGGHPLAGRERSGLAMAQATLFDGKPWLFCPPEGATVDSRLQAFVAGLGAARVITLTPARHDMIMAFISHFPQLYSTLLINLLDQAGREDPQHAVDLLQFQGTGIAGHLRLAASPYAMWHEVFSENADNLSSVLRAWQALTSQAQGVLASSFDNEHQEDAPQDVLNPLLETWFTRANTLYDTFLNLQASQVSEPHISG
ncbi:MAG: prephenate dehydrogenase/arogenate dehydrogenase family protein [Vampirovibrionales bacterium]|nr:prephenate dehydrogenase/arogenate dehydrogenase family protein [Vampirovibrionales bacterium]